MSLEGVANNIIVSCGQKRNFGIALTEAEVMSEQSATEYLRMAFDEMTMYKKIERYMLRKGLYKVVEGRIQLEDMEGVTDDRLQDIL